MISHPCVKVNLGLNVLRKREDSYHELETLFLPYPLIHDTLEIIRADAYSETSAELFAKYSGPKDDGRIRQAIREDGKLMITIAREEGVDWDPLNDLSARAYALLDNDFNLPPVKIFLEKTSPVGAGLGGGSADAAYALRMLSELFELGLDDAILASYAARLGSDCAFFIYRRPMIGEGRGEILTPYDELDWHCPDDSVPLKAGAFPALEGLELRVHVPEGIAVSTREAYGGIVPRDRSDKVLLPLREALALPVEAWKDALVNDFEATVFKLHPELAAIKRRLYEEGAVYASMSGSGSALFSLQRPQGKKIN